MENSTCCKPPIRISGVSVILSQKNVIWGLLTVKPGKLFIHPSLNPHKLSVTKYTLHSSISPSISFSSTEGDKQLCRSWHITYIVLKHQDTHRLIERELVSRVWLYFAVQKSFGAILRQTSLKERLCQINTAFHCSLVR